MESGRELEQLFVGRRSGRVELRMVFEDPAGARHREALPLPTTQPDEAVRMLGRILARRGDVGGAPRLRVREERGGALVDRDDLRTTFLTAFEEELRDDA